MRSAAPAAKAELDISRETFNLKRHPYTYACDLIRQASTDPYGSAFQACTVSRSQASQIRKLFADVLGIDDHELALKLSAAYQQKHIQRGAA